MTALQCQRCNRYWSITTKWPDTFKAINRWCPDCLPVALPRMGNSPLPKRRIA